MSPTSYQAAPPRIKLSDFDLLPWVAGAVKTVDGRFGDIDGGVRPARKFSLLSRGGLLPRDGSDWLRSSGRDREPDEGADDREEEQAEEES
jgi:hypothetical protein